MAVNFNNINRLVKNASYAVRGSIVTRSMELSKQLKENPGSLPFREIISCNIGNPQALKQEPLTFMRDVLALVVNPRLKERATFPSDVIARAQKYLEHIPGVGGNKVVSFHTVTMACSVNATNPHTYLTVLFESLHGKPRHFNGTRRYCHVSRAP